MRALKNSKKYLTALIVVSSFGAPIVRASVPPSLVPSINLATAVPGSTVQAVEDIPDQASLEMIYNDLLMGMNMNIPGWSLATHEAPSRPMILRAFAVRTTKNPKAVEPGQSLFYGGKGVGRSGVWELEADGSRFAIVNGHPMKGLTIKGYGGNAGSSQGQQPQGSMNAREAYRDILLSKILIEKGIDAYLGTIEILRPVKADDGSVPKINVNFIRISRSSLRLNDVMDRKGAELRQTVEHLTKLLKDEVGHQMSPEEFAQWLVQRSAFTLGAKEQARIKSSNNNKDNFGIAELVDFGEASYNPETYVPGSDTLPLTTKGYTLGRHVVAAAQNIAEEYKFKIDAEALFEQTYQATFGARESEELSRVNLETATSAELEALGISAKSVLEIMNMRYKPFGILTTREVADRVPNSGDRQIILNRTTTRLLRMKNGLSLPNAVVDELGGADGVRKVMNEVMMSLGHQLSNPALVKKTAEAALTSALKARGFDGFINEYSIDYGVHVVKLLTEQLVGVMSNDPTFAPRELPRLKSSRAYSCRAIFN